MKNERRRKLTGSQATIISAIIAAIATCVASLTTALVNIFTGDNKPILDTETTIESVTKIESLGDVSSEILDSIENTGYEDNTNSNINANNIAVADVLKNYVYAYYAYLNEPNIFIKISKNFPMFVNDKDLYFPLDFHIYISSSFDVSEGEKLIELKTIMHEDYSMDEVNMSILTIKDENTYMVDEVCLNKINAVFDGENFIFYGNIFNEYIPLYEMCIESIYAS